MPNLPRQRNGGIHAQKGRLRNRRMTLQQKRAAAAIAFLIVAAAAAYLLVLAIAVGISQGPAGDRFPGRLFMLVIHNQSSLELMLKALPILITAGISIFVKYELKDWQYFGTVAVSAIGAIASLYLLLELSAPDQANRFWANSPVEEIQNFASFIAASRPFLIGAGVWFVGILLLQLGLKPGASE